MRILLIEDDILLGQGIVTGLSQGGFALDWVQDGEDAETAIRGTAYDALVLDLGLPKVDGLTLLRHMRKSDNRMPVLILTARDAIEDRVAGLDAGADDYLIKPFDLTELQARLRALVRRANGISDSTLYHNRVALMISSRTVTLDDKPITLSDREFVTLQELMLNTGRVLSKNQLEEKLYGWGEEIESNTIEVYIHHIRRKLYPELIKTIRGVGYMIPKEDP
ncbi:response regulator [Terasakiella sp.]|uniref:response regulator n=1 Tax=Terasakiella sp. TaxID=2034861 RepID=UPI003AA91419